MEIKFFLEEHNIKYRAIDNYILAFTHMSFVHESKIFFVESYERLEFLGDAVLGHIVSEYIYKNFSEMSEGELTLLRSNLVNKKNLGKIGRELNFEKYIKIGQGEQKDNLSDSVYEDIFESLVGAIYLDIGYRAVKKFVLKHIKAKIDTINFNNLKDFKTKLQEVLQSAKGKSVNYKLVKQKRIDNVMHFWSNVIFDDQILGQGHGLSKKDAEQKAAKDAYNRMAK